MTTTPQKSPAEQLATPVQFLKGVGPQRAELLAKLDLHYAADVLFCFPRAYQDMSELREIDQLEERKNASVVGVIDSVPAVPVVQPTLDAGETGRGPADSRLGRGQAGGHAVGDDPSAGGTLGRR